MALATILDPPASRDDDIAGTGPDAGLLTARRSPSAPEPKDIILFVCGGTGGLHATVLHTFGSCLSQTRPPAEITSEARHVAAN